MPYRAERVRFYRQNFALRDVRIQVIVRRGLQPVESYLAGLYVALESAVGHLRGKGARHYLLITHFGVAQLLRTGISAVKAHEHVRLFIRVFSAYVGIKYVL